MNKEKQYNLRTVTDTEVAVTFMGGEITDVMGKCCFNCKHHTGGYFVSNHDLRYKDCDKLNISTFEFNVCDGYEFNKYLMH